ncbi:C40 family peptidase [Streptomyces sp. CA-111067]|uniref:C40 family peptidase n=1 Tax=Streptomyces sp. CA-111067 TaxID=3240046 RepID=UPI003D999CF5
MSVVRRTRGWMRSAVVCGTLLAAAALALPAAQQAAARPDGPPALSPSASLPDLLDQLHTLYLQTETATESYNQAKETADTQRGKAEELDRQLADQRVAVADSKAQLGLMARQMYQDGSVSPYLSMLTGESPQDFFGSLRVVDRAAGHQKDVLDDLTSGEARLAALNTQAQQALDKAQQSQTLQAARKSAVDTHLRQVEALLAGLTGVQRGELQNLEQQDVDKAQKALLDSKALGADPALGAPSKAGDAAIAYAFKQLGKPYVWGAQGPDSFDCSGLTSQAWAHAGVTIPRTSQQQWAQLPRVPLSLLRPGDLVIYFSGASHVALYIGDGLVIQAPRPGAFVKVSPIAANPILGAVRPDSTQLPLAHYKARKVPAQAERPTPISVPPVTSGKGGPPDSDPASLSDPTKNGHGGDWSKHPVPKPTTRPSTSPSPSTSPTAPASPTPSGSASPSPSGDAG